MTDREVLDMLKVNLEIKNQLRDKYLSQLIEVAKEEIRHEGVKTLSMEDMTDVNLIVMYAAYLYRMRAITDVNTTVPTDMPRMLRYALNKRIFREKAVM